MKELLTAIRKLFASKPITPATPECSIPPHILAEYHFIQNNIFESRSQEQVTTCRRWADQLHEKYPRYGVLRSKLYRQCGVQQRLITAAAGLLNSVPGIVHSNSKATQ